MQKQDQAIPTTRELTTREEEPLEQILELDDDQDSVDLSEVSAEYNKAVVDR